VDALPGVGGGVVAQHAEQVQAGRVGQNGSAVPGWGEGPQIAQRLQGQETGGALPQTAT
jgi:hypothetical protein